ncbi:hypothetical protein TTHERM_00794220 (macronuclear) [Tetrahymena thermophila SB210]|uniref:Leucine Rich Repeat family protein n=1 Tax=Tetrahymena thermophila (strain SB210) TaxID=312017 RepID=Q23W09_TETTS|nr:hypothetical protein TTHERM_00794220 [Tetrahymena thermophila SB210]EAS00696.2 hypothetical protein TTHERM_00794220 [Tetrahymena thermophila SB210]|eukprot:XP_001020941.2 hypothetical protein TTHERM_00794220 [Tetrahymena thermophila SB210]
MDTIMKVVSLKEQLIEQSSKINDAQTRSSKSFRISSPLMQQVKLFQTKSQQNQKRKDSYSTQSNSPIAKYNNFNQFANTSQINQVDREILDITRQSLLSSQTFRNSDQLSPRTLEAAKKYFQNGIEFAEDKDSVQEDSYSDSSSSEDENRDNQNDNNDLLLEEELSEWKTLKIEDVFSLFEAKCADNKLKILPQQLFKFVDKLKSQIKKGSLNLQELQLGVQSSKKVIQLLKNNSKSKYQFSKLLLAKNNFGDQGIQLLCNFLNKQRRSNIVHLDISNNNITSEGIKQVVKMVSLNQNIISLDISSYDGYNRNRLSRSACIALSQYIAQTEVLQFLKMQNCCIGPQGLFSLSKGFAANRSIISLDISKNDIGKDCSQCFESILSHSKIMELNLRGNFLGDQSITKIGELLKPGLKMCVLNILDISNNKLTSDGINNFFESIQKNQYLERLILDQNNLRGGLPEIIQFLQENSNITYLSMIDCCIYPEVVESIATGLSRNNSLKSLILSKNFIKDQGAEMIAQSMKYDPNLITNRRLKMLDLSKCAIEDYGGQVLSDAFKSHQGIIEISLCHNLLGDASGFSLIDLARNNQKIIKLDLDMNLIRLDYMQEIQRLIDMNVDNHKSMREPYLKEKLIELKSIEQRPEDFQKKEEEFQKKNNLHSQEINKYKDLHQQEEQECKQMYDKLMDEFVDIKKINQSIIISKDYEIQHNKILADYENQISELRIENEKLQNELQAYNAQFQSKYQVYSKRKSQLEEQKKKLYDKKLQMIMQVEDASKINKDLENKVKQIQDRIKLLQQKTKNKPNRKQSANIKQAK